MSNPIAQALRATVFVGNYIPAHDETFDLAEEIGDRLEKFRTYIEGVRDAEQAQNALEELAEAIKYACTQKAVTP